MTAQDDFDSAIKQLFDIAQEKPRNEQITDANLPQVHAMNCLKAIFTTARLAQKSEEYIVSGLQASANSLNSTV